MKKTFRLLLAKTTVKVCQGTFSYLIPKLGWKSSHVGNIKDLLEQLNQIPKIINDFSYDVEYTVRQYTLHTIRLQSFLILIKN